MECITLIPVDGLRYVIFCDERYTVFLLATNQSLVFKNSAIRRSGESVIKLFLVSISGFSQHCLILVLTL